MARVLGIDLGQKRIGLAVSDGLGLTAQPHATIARHGGRRDVEAIGRALADVGASTVVIGLPLGLEGEEGPAARRARAFAKNLREALGVEVELVDERFSTREAEEILLAADVSRGRRRQVVDKLAAAVILQRWLDERRAAHAAPGGVERA
jgi:putative Holliday junction resolvase